MGLIPEPLFEDPLKTLELKDNAGMPWSHSTLEGKEKEKMKGKVATQEKDKFQGFF